MITKSSVFKSIVIPCMRIYPSVNRSREENGRRNILKAWILQQRTTKNRKCKLGKDISRKNSKNNKNRCNKSKCNKNKFKIKENPNNIANIKNNKKDRKLIKKVVLICLRNKSKPIKNTKPKNINNMPDIKLNKN